MSEVSHRTTEDTRTASVSPLPFVNNNNYANTNVTSNPINEVDGGAPIVVTNRIFRRTQSTQPNRKLSNTSYPLIHLHSARGRSKSIPTSPASAQSSHISPSFDRRLNDFLLDNRCDDAARIAVFNEGFTYEDFVYDMQKEDLCRIGLK